MKTETRKGLAKRQITPRLVAFAEPGRLVKPRLISDWTELLVENAARSPRLMERLIEIEKLQAKSVDVSVPCDEVAQMLADPGDDVEELAAWVSKDCHAVLEHLRNEVRRMQRGIKLAFICVPGSFVAFSLASLSYLGWQLATLLGLVAALLAAGIIAFVFFPLRKLLS
jgi:hypothetical protein